MGMKNRRGLVAAGVFGLLGLALLDPGCVIKSTSTEADAGSSHDGGASSGGSSGGGTDGGNCAAGQSFCGGSCIETSSDDSNCGGCGKTCSGGQHCAAGSCQESKIQHVVLIVQENHTFEAYFGLYCQAAPGSGPTCTTGPQCCEGAPSADPSGAMPVLLDDDPNNSASNFATDRDHDQVCELQELDDGKMDHFVAGATATGCAPGSTCSNAYNWALADGSSSSGTVAYYWTLARANALADRYFQPIAGGTASNDMYFAGARFRFIDNGAIPAFAAGETTSNPPGLCTDEYDPLSCLAAPQALYQDGNIASLLLGAGKTFGVYADGYAGSTAAVPGCPARTAVSECPYSDCIAHPEACNGCIFDPSDIPFSFFGDFNAPSSKYFANIKDYGNLQTDISSSRLPNFSYVKARLFHNEHPNYSTIADGIQFVQSTVQLIEQSPYASSTLILLTWDEGGGFFDHVSPPAPVPTTADRDDSGNAVPYGTRVPMLAIGPFARKGSISHEQMEHSSIVKFLEYNFLGPVGQLHGRDAVVNNMGSLLDPSKTGVAIPEK